MEPIFFDSPAAFRTWLEAHHETAAELWVGYHKKHTGRPSMTWPESVDEALCYGWIDGIRKSLGAESYVIRFTPRKPTSIWSAVNIRNVGRLRKAGLMTPAGLRAFNKRTAANSRIYSYEQKRIKLAPEDEAAFRKRPKAWAFFETMSPSYRKSAIAWVVSAKREETRAKRLAALVACSAAEEKLPNFQWKPK